LRRRRSAGVSGVVSAGLRPIIATELPPPSAPLAQAVKKNIKTAVKEVSRLLQNA
jgi:hypothetical protein